MNFRTLVFAVSLFFGFFANAQLTMHKMAHAGYVYQNGSFGTLGATLLFLENDDVVYRGNAAVMLGAANGKFAVMPKVQGDVLINFERGVDFYHAYYFLAGAEATTKYFAPKVGATLAGIIDVTGGYAFPIGKLNGQQMKGLNINVALNVPIVLIKEYLK